MRKHVALRLLESVDADEAFDLTSESWLRTEAAASYGALKADPSRAIPAEDVRTRLPGQVARPFVTGRVSYTPKALQQLNGLHDWITKAASSPMAGSGRPRSLRTKKIPSRADDAVGDGT